MPGFLDEYGVSDARRERGLKYIFGAIALVLIAALGVWLALRNYPENRQVRLFLEDLKKSDFKAAYSRWGCTDSNPCKDYPFNKFMEDWGPNSGHNAASARIDKSFRQSFSQSCSSGVIYNVVFDKGEPATLWVDRKEHAVGFAPWPVCNPTGPIGQ